MKDIKFKKGDIVLCVDDNSVYKGLVLGKEYTVVYSDEEITQVEGLSKKWLTVRFKLKEQDCFVFDQVEINKKEVKEYEILSNYFNPQLYYNNDKGSIYQFAEDHNLNSWEFDIIKRIVRSRKKGKFIEDLDKTIDTIKLYKLEYNEK